MASYVVLNLADPGGIGPVSRVKAGIEAKHAALGGVDVAMYDLFDFLANDQAGSLTGSEADLQKVALACENATKIYLCTHGTAKDTDHGFAKASGGDALGTWEDYGRLLHRIFKSDTGYDLALVMCYGARTDMYRASDLDHNGMIPAALIKTSFAYKLFKYLCEHSRDVCMTARTGAVAFDEKTGKSAVEQEVSIDISLDKEEYLRSPMVAEIIANWKARKAAPLALEGKKQAKAFTRFAAVDSKFRTDPEARPKWRSGTESDGKAYHQMLAHKRELEDQKMSHGDLEKFGKIIFTWNLGTLSVVNKYGSKQAGTEPGAVLYHGPFI